MLDHHVLHLPLRLHVPRRDCFPLPRLWRRVLLVVHAEPAQDASSGQLDRWVVECGGQYHCDACGELCVSHVMILTRQLAELY